MIRWNYGVPRVPKGRATYVVSCALGALSGSANGQFDVQAQRIAPTSLRVHVTTNTPPQPEFTPDPSLLSLRESAVSLMTSTLGSQWKTATRGLGNLQVVGDSADITIFVVAAKGTSVNRTSLRDGSEDIVVFVSDPVLGGETPENSVATALHELGHIWCCQGPDADSGGHWRVKLRDPGLYGVDKYGLMTDPVLCAAFGSILSCPNRFSDREMRALGFATFPAPVPDPCVTQALSLEGRAATIDQQLVGLETQIKTSRVSLASLDSQISSIEAQYRYLQPPPSVYATYQNLIAQYNSLSAVTNTQVDQYNGLLEQEHSLVTQRNGLPCDAS